MGYLPFVFSEMLGVLLFRTRLGPRTLEERTKGKWVIFPLSFLKC